MYFEIHSTKKMDNNITTRNRMLAQKVIKGLESRNMTGYYAETKEEALQKALELIPKGSTIGWGGSVSIAQIGLRDAICNGEYIVYNRDTCETPEAKRETELKIFGSDYFLCSSNAITEDGILVNIDGNSNRVAAIAYGPAHVVMVVGMNKVAKDIDSALSRARNIAAPINAQRFPLDTPCKKNGSCVNCKSMDTICCEFLITRFSRHVGRIHIILVNEELGY